MAGEVESIDTGGAPPPSYAHAGRATSECGASRRFGSRIASFGGCKASLMLVVLATI